MEIFTIEFISHHSNCDKAQQIRNEMIKSIIDDKKITLLEYERKISFGLKFLQIVLPLYRETKNQKYKII